MSTLSVFGICCVSPPPTPPTGGEVSVLFIPDSIKLNNYLVVLFLALLGFKAGYFKPEGVG